MSIGDFRLSMSLKYGSREWLDSCAKETGMSWCEWPEEFSKSKDACRTCLSYYVYKRRRGMSIERETKQALHVETQKLLISSIKKRKESEEKERKNSIHYKFAQDRKHEIELSNSYTVSAGKEHEEKLKGIGQYCTYHHSCYDEKRCTCKRDREGFLKWYSSYDKIKHCVKCDSLICDCARTKDGKIIKKIVVKEIYEQEGGKCQLHDKTNCDCADSVKCIITETFDGKYIHKYCTLHKDVGCDCDKFPKFYKIIKQVPGAGWEYD